MLKAYQLLRLQSKIVFFFFLAIRSAETKKRARKHGREAGFLVSTNSAPCCNKSRSELRDYSSEIYNEHSSNPGTDPENWAAAA